MPRTDPPQHAVVVDVLKIDEATGKHWEEVGREYRLAEARARIRAKYRNRYLQEQGRKTADAYDPDESRDEHGRWGTGGGGDMSSLLAQAKKEGVDLDLRQQAGKHWNLENIERQRAAQPGAGAKVMQALNELADRHGAKISLIVGGGSERLVEYYERFGYRVSSENENEIKMLRKPQRAGGGGSTKMPTGHHDPQQPIYLRVGDWNPKNPRSGNYATGSIEAGLSVYDLDEHGKPIAPEEGEWAEDDLHERLRGDEPKYIVQGDHVGVGHDGEPLLGRNVRVVGIWQPKTADAVYEESQHPRGEHGKWTVGGGHFAGEHLRAEKASAEKASAEKAAIKLLGNVTVYHGTGMNHPHSMWFTTAPDLAQTYAKTSAEAFGGTPRVFERRLEIKKPYVTEPGIAESLPYNTEHLNTLRRQGYDVVTSPNGHDIYVIDPKIIHHATMNLGAVDLPSREEKRFNRLHETAGEGFPNLHDYRVVSGFDKSYNCAGEAFGDDSRWWWPEKDSFWPKGLAKDGTVENFDELMFERMRGTLADDEKPEPGYVKLALFVNHEGTPTHIARQLPSGSWRSKEGMQAVVEHDLHEMEGGFYGDVGPIYKLKESQWRKMAHMR